MKKKKTHKVTVMEMRALEELFYDETRRKMRAIFTLYDLSIEAINEIRSFTQQLEALSHENVLLLKKYEKK